MNKIVLFLVIIFLSFTTLTLTQDVSNETKASQLILEGDNFAEVTFENQKALSKYSEASALSNKNYEIYWKISRCYVDIGEHYPANTDAEKAKQEQTYKTAYAYADSAVKINPTGSMGYARRAIANGRIALFKGIWENIGLVKQTKADLDKAIELDNKNATAYYVLGRTNTKVSEKSKIIRWPLGLGWANLDDAVKNYEKAISLRPDFIMYRLDAARAYVELKQYAKAKEHLNIIPTLKTQDEDDDKFRKETKELLDTIVNK
ncbi:MAG: tetratricopeptide repeat protein [Bacteroidota bacterium]|nr:tetratricopeptide repeat protein [Bacteroidota bacterium]